MPAPEDGYSICITLIPFRRIFFSSTWLRHFKYWNSFVLIVRLKFCHSKHTGVLISSQSKQIITHVTKLFWFRFLTLLLSPYETIIPSSHLSITVTAMGILISAVIIEWHQISSFHYHLDTNKNLLSLRHS